MSTLDKLIELRKRLNVKQKEIAIHLGVTKSTMSKYESGKRDISAKNQDKYAEYLGIELTIILK